jgi:hypothetical protein
MIRNPWNSELESAGIRCYWNEEWRTIVDSEIGACDRFLVSNYGRLAFRKIKGNTWVLKRVSVSNGYPSASFTVNTGLQVRKPLHKLVAQTFIPREDNDQDQVIHLDHNRENNTVKNLRWASRSEQLDHTMNVPRLKPVNGRRGYHKLTDTEVLRLKKMIIDPKRKTRMKLIARQFGISEMQLYRIKRGENWKSPED